jgi:hypothetical protein
MSSQEPSPKYEIIRLRLSDAIAFAFSEAGEQALPGTSKQFAAVDNLRVRRSITADGDPRVLIQSPVVVWAAFGMAHEVAGLQGDGLRGTENFAFVGIPGPAKHEHIALVRVIVRTAHDACRKVIDRQVVAGLRRIAFNDCGFDSEGISFGGPPGQLVELDADKRPFGESRRQRQRGLTWRRS